MQTHISDVQDFFASKVYQDTCKNEEGKAKVTEALFSHLDSIIKAIGAVVKSLPRTRF